MRTLSRFPTVDLEKHLLLALTSDGKCELLLAKAASELCRLVGEMLLHSNLVPVREKEAKSVVTSMALTTGYRYNGFKENEPPQGSGTNGRCGLVSVVKLKVDPTSNEGLFVDWYKFSEGLFPENSVSLHAAIRVREKLVPIPVYLTQISAYHVRPKETRFTCAFQPVEHCNRALSIFNVVIASVINKCGVAVLFSPNP
ncbi:hypothetical protein STEG23_034219, partial [Scotinomys teguina]